LRTDQPDQRQEKYRSQGDYPKVPGAHKG
jgi:hypothetical protein